MFVTSFHHVGRELSGIMEATAFARLEAFEDSEDRQYVSMDFFLCSLEPFVLLTKRTRRTSRTHLPGGWMPRSRLRSRSTAIDCSRSARQMPPITPPNPAVTPTAGYRQRVGP